MGNNYYSLYFRSYILHKRNRRMNTIGKIKKTMGCKDKDGIPRGWIVYYDNKHNIKEVKNLFKPHEYKGARPMYNDKQIIKLLTKEL